MEKELPKNYKDWSDSAQKLYNEVLDDQDFKEHKLLLLRMLCNLQTSYESLVIKQFSGAWDDEVSLEKLEGRIKRASQEMRNIRRELGLDYVAPARNETPRKPRNANSYYGNGKT